MIKNKQQVIGTLSFIKPGISLKDNMKQEIFSQKNKQAGADKQYKSKLKNITNIF